MANLGRVQDERTQYYSLAEERTRERDALISAITVGVYRLDGVIKRFGYSGSFAELESIRAALAAARPTPERAEPTPTPETNDG